ncbi:MAG: MBL fold metallo-hydrolase [Alphaproteobacteria bacterium]|nr:MBL fold metallo-hydrolase [Alphaproteobacteria bacterium]MBQ9235279.1 MBL fold metallo-hydrolase [Alphaproteobacteria bacterium]
MVKKVEVFGALCTNAYFYIDEKSGHGFLIDAAAEADKLAAEAAKNHWTIEKILLTHGHFDHIGAVAELSRKFNAPYLAHREAAKYLLDPQWNLSAWSSAPIILPDAVYLDDGAIITLAAAPSVELQVLHTPGHTLDGIVMYDAAAQTAFVGDTVFKDAVGRTDLFGGDAAQLAASIKNKILPLPDVVKLYSGHTEATTVGAVRQYFSRLG